VFETVSFFYNKDLKLLSLVIVVCVSCKRAAVLTSAASCRVTQAEYSMHFAVRLYGVCSVGPSDGRFKDASGVRRYVRQFKRGLKIFDVSAYLKGFFLQSKLICYIYMTFFHLMFSILFVFTHFTCFTHCIYLYVFLL
jgi:hypothetical protein